MNLMELRKKPHLSASGINAYQECGLYYRFSRLDKIKPEFISDALVFGSVMHKVIAHFHEARIIGESLDTKAMQEKFEKYWLNAAKDNETIKYKKGNSYRSLLNMGKRLLKTYAENNTDNDNFNVLAVEEPFRLKIEGLPVPVIGAMDLLEEDASGTLIITDHKTLSRAYSPAEVDKNFQLTVYHMAARENSSRDIVMKFDCLIKTRTPRFEQFYTVRSEESIRKAIKKITLIWSAMEKEVFLPNDNSWRCGFCEYSSHCKKWFEE